MDIIKNSAVFLWVCALSARTYPVAEMPLTMRKEGHVVRCDPLSHRVQIGSLRVRAQCTQRSMTFRGWVSGRRQWLFIDGDSVECLDFARAWPQAMIVIVKGKPIALSRALGRNVFVDYGARLSTFFKLQALPALVVLEGHTATVSEGQC